jgi:hypothetical protein
MDSKLYVYQIQGLLERPDRSIGGIRTLVCSIDYFESVDVPSDVLDKEMLAYLRFRSAVCDYMDIAKLPIPIVNRLRKTIGQWLDRYVLDNF